MTLRDSKQIMSAREGENRAAQRARRSARGYWTLALAVTFTCVAGAASTRTGSQPVAAAQQAFTPNTVIETARRASAAAFAPRRLEGSSPLQQLTYDQYRDIRFDSDQGLWRNEQVPFRLELLPAGFLFKSPSQSVHRRGPDCPGNHRQAADVLARTAGREGPRQSGAAAVRVPGTHPPQLALGVGRVPRVPGRFLFPCGRTRRRLWTVGAWPCAAHRTSDGRGISCVHALLDRAAGGERNRRSSCTRCSTANRRRAPIASR